MKAKQEELARHQSQAVFPWHIPLKSTTQEQAFCLGLWLPINPSQQEVLPPGGRFP